MNTDIISPIQRSHDDICLSFTSSEMSPNDSDANVNRSYLRSMPSTPTENQTLPLSNYTPQFSPINLNASSINIDSGSIKNRSRRHARATPDRLCPRPRRHRHFQEDEFDRGDNQHHTDENDEQIAGLPFSRMIITSLGADDHVATSRDRQELGNIEHDRIGIQTYPSEESPPPASSSSSSSSSSSPTGEETEEERREREEAESEALARQFMAEEAMASYNQSAHFLQDHADQYSEEDLAALRVVMAEENPIVEEPGYDHDGESEESEEMSYEALLNLGERMGDVKSERWALRARDEIAKLECKPYCKEMGKGKDENDSGVKCLVCQYAYEEGEMVRILPCGHYFHNECVDQWLLGKDVCPYCRQCIVDSE